MTERERSEALGTLHRLLESYESKAQTVREAIAAIQSESEIDPSSHGCANRYPELTE